MCGLAGYVGPIDTTSRIRLILELSEGIDSRGGHACGFVTRHADGTPEYGRKLGKFKDAGTKFMARACMGEAAGILHARFATCGKRAEKEAHPYVIQRSSNGEKRKTVLWGAHNGVISNAEDTAKKNGREFITDSREMFELLADGKIADITAHRGWGTLAWMLPSQVDRIYIVAMTDGAALEIAKLKCGASVFASTRHILDSALKEADLEPDLYWTVSAKSIEVGKVVSLQADGAKYSATYADTPISLKTYSKTDYYADKFPSGNYGNYDYSGYGNYGDGYGASSHGRYGRSPAVRVYRNGVLQKPEDYAKRWEDTFGSDPHHVDANGDGLHASKRESHSERRRRLALLKSRNGERCQKCWHESEGRHHQWCPVLGDIAKWLAKNADTAGAKAVAETATMGTARRSASGYVTFPAKERDTEPSLPTVDELKGPECPECHETERTWQWAVGEAYCEVCDHQWDPSTVQARVRVEPDEPDAEDVDFPVGCETWTDAQWDAYMKERYKDEPEQTADATVSDASNAAAGEAVDSEPDIPVRKVVAV